MHHILKGGEDSIGALEAIQRVYFNIGSCSEQCWTNHLTDLRQLDPTGRNFGQTPFNIGQCRRDCPNFRAIEDRLPNILAFLESKETDATDLAKARENALRKDKPQAVYAAAELERDLDKQFGARCRRARTRSVRRELRALSLVDSRDARAARSRTATFARWDPTECAPTGWDRTRRRSHPKSAPIAAVRCTRIT